MADSASFVVKLINKVTSPARAIMQSIGRVAKAFAAVKFAANFAFGSNLKRAGMIGAIVGVHLLKAGWEKVSKAVAWARTKLIDFGKNALIIGGAALGFAAVSFTKQVIDMARFAETSKLAFKNLTGSASGFEAAKNLANELGQSVTDTTNSMLKLLAAQFKMGEATDIIKLAADMQAVGTSADKVQSIIFAITQIKSKGRLQGEELTQQLAEANVATTLVYKALAAETGKSIDQVRAMISAGLVDADMGIRAIQTAIMEKVGEKTPGQAGKEFANTSLTGLIQRLQNAPSNFFLRVAEQAKSIVPRLKVVVDMVSKAIESISPEAASKFMGKMVGLIEMLVPLVIELGKGFADNFGGIIDALGGKDITDSKARWFELGRNIATVARWGVLAMNWIAKAINFAVSPLGKVIVGFILFGAAIGAVLGPIVSFAFTLLQVFMAYRMFMALGGQMVAWGGLGARVFAPLIALAETLVGLLATAGAAILAIVGWPILIGVAIVAAVGLIWYFWDEIVNFGKKFANWFADLFGFGGVSAVMTAAIETPKAATAGATGGGPDWMQRMARVVSPETSNGALQGTPTMQPGALAMAAQQGGTNNVAIRQITINSNSDKPAELAQEFADELKRMMSGTADAAAGA